MDITILLVDDDDIHRTVIRHLLQNQTTLVIEATNGKQALHYLAISKIELVITDLMMPEVDGITLISSLKAEPKTKGIPIIAMTGTRDADIQQRAKEAGANDVFTKPIDETQLISHINTYYPLEQKTLKKRLVYGGESCS